MRPKHDAATEERDDGARAPDSGPERVPDETGRHDSKPLDMTDPEVVEAEIERLHAREEELLRALAEMTNVQKRRKVEAEQTARYAKESLLRELLPVLDDFERALAAMPGTPHDPLHAGVELVRDRMRRILEKEGLVPIQAAGQPFDHNLHDAIGERVAPPGTPPGTVLEVAQPGYLFQDRVLRHAKVVVAALPTVNTLPPTME